MALDRALVVIVDGAIPEDTPFCAKKPKAEVTSSAGPSGCPRRP